MALRISSAEADDTSDTIWSLPPSTKFIQSPALETLKREILRYLQQEIPGRSFLIAGHRGAGKTALAMRAVEDTYRVVIRAKGSDSQARLPLADVQRPLLVRVHGPSLLAEHLPSPGPAPVQSVGESQRTPRPGAGSQSQRVGVGPTPVSGQNADDVTELVECGTQPVGNRERATDQFHGALVQVMIALYRSLAYEVGRAFTLHARESYSAHPGDQLELAAQFILELDQAPDPATLRAYWARLNRLQTGVFWPQPIVERMIQNGSPDIGYREIIAVSVAAQAFQVCIGNVKYSQTNKVSAAYDAALKSTAQFNLKGFLSGLFGLAFGGAVATAVQMAGHQTVASVLAGLLSGSVGAMTVSWSSSRSRKNASDSDYSFIRDRSVATLERDLPFIIQRIREAGLAPVFVVDELDKVPNASDALSAIITRLKYLTTDYSFFCFLTDRDYYEEVRRRVQQSVYPNEHTYFSQWLFVLYQPNELLLYLRNLIRSTLDPATQEFTTDQFAISVLSLAIIHRARLNTVDVVRELARYAGTADVLTMTAAQIRSHAPFQFAATIQMAIQKVLQGQSIAARMQDDPLFAQLAIDLAYYISREWEADSDNVRTDEDAIFDYILRRLRRPIPSAGADKRRAIQETVGSLELDQLTGIVGEIVDRLSNFDYLRSELRNDPEYALLTDIVPVGVTSGLIEAVERKQGSFQFVFDVYGREVRIRNVTAVGAISPEIKQEIEMRLRFLDELLHLLDTLHLRLAELVALQVLPPTVSSGTVAQASQRLQIAAKRGQSYSELPVDLPLIQRVENAVRNSAPVLSALFLLAARIEKEVAAPFEKAFRSIFQYVDVAKLRESSLLLTKDTFNELFANAPKLETNPQTSDRLDFARLNADLQAKGAERLGAAEIVQLAEKGWGRWARRFVSLFGADDTERIVRDVEYEDILLAASDQAPSNLLQSDLGQVSIADWSRLALLGARDGGDTKPRRWPVIVGLALLGFGGRVLNEVWTEFLVDIDPNEFSIVSSFLSTPDSSQGVIFVTSGVGPPTPARPSDLEYPILVINNEELLQYDRLLRTMRRANALGGVVYEEDEDGAT